MKYTNLAKTTIKMNNANNKNWRSESVKKFYSENRSEPSQLYKSEKFFLEKINLYKKSVLDIGCACEDSLISSRCYITRSIILE